MNTMKSLVGVCLQHTLPRTPDFFAHVHLLKGLLAFSQGGCALINDLEADLHPDMPHSILNLSFCSEAEKSYLLISSERLPTKISRTNSSK